MKILLLLLLSIPSFAADQQVELSTSHGRILVDIYNPGMRSALLLAPGAGCGPRLDMYDQLAATARERGFTLVRVYWAYCVSEPQGKPSNGLVHEEEDFASAFRYVRDQLGFAESSIVVGGKSQGSFVSQALFQHTASLPALLLLTPVCTDDEKDPAQNVFAEAYPGLERESRPVLLAQGDTDALCHRAHFNEFLSARGENFSAARVEGDHGFGFKNADGTYDTVRGLANLRLLSDLIAPWLR